MKKNHLLSGKLRNIIAGCPSILLVGTAAGCGVTDIEPALAPSQADKTGTAEAETETGAPESITEVKDSKERAESEDSKAAASTNTSVENSATEEKSEKNGDIYSLYLPCCRNDNDGRNVCF